MRWTSPLPRRRTRDIPRRPLASLALVLAAACSSDSGTGAKVDSTGTTAELQFLAPRPDAPPLAASSTSFWAKKGENRELRLYYHARAGHADSTEFLRFRVDDRSLDRRPDGSAIATGDSVLITVSVSDLANLVVDFQPAGLKFSAARPARLTIKFAEADDDLGDDDDGVDPAVLGELAIWRRETPADPWVRQASTLNTSEQELETDVFGFTNYAIAYRR